MNLDFDLIPTKIDKDGPCYSSEKVNNIAMKLVLQDSYFQTKGKSMSNQIDEATAVVNDAQKKFNHAIEAFVSTNQIFVESVKKTSSQVRDSADKLMGGLQKVEKTADFNRLERYVDLLERAAVAMNSLADLEKQGKLEKIASALK